MRIISLIQTSFFAFTIDPLKTFGFISLFTYPKTTSTHTRQYQTTPLHRAFLFSFGPPNHQQKHTKHPIWPWNGPESDPRSPSVSASWRTACRASEAAICCCWLRLCRWRDDPKRDTELYIPNGQDLFQQNYRVLVDFINRPKGSMVLPYMVTFTINIPQMLAYIYIYTIHGSVMGDVNRWFLTHSEPVKKTSFDASDGPWFALRCPQSIGLLWDALGKL